MSAALSDRRPDPGAQFLAIRRQPALRPIHQPRLAARHVGLLRAARYEELHP